MSSPSAAPVVSLQAHGAQDPDPGHLATGLLVHPSMVFVPAPPEALLDRAGRFEVLIFPASPAAADPLIERIRPVGLTVPYADTAGPPLGATIRLSRPSRNPLSIRRELGRPAIPGRALQQLLADGHDLWTALAELEVISPALRRPPSKALWNRLRSAEQNQAEQNQAEQIRAEQTQTEAEDTLEASRPGPAPRTHGLGGAGAGAGSPGAMQALGFNACWLFPWWCDDD